MPPKIRVIITDDKQRYIDELTLTLQYFPEIEVVGTAPNGIELLKLLGATEVDILLLDIQMPKMNGYEALGKLKEKHPHIKVIVQSFYYTSYHVAECLKIGASAVFGKGVDIEKLVDAINIIHADGDYMDEATVKLLKQEYDPRTVKKSFIHQKALNEIEIEILKLICEGRTPKQIRGDLKMAKSTYDLNKKKLKEKSMCKCDVDLVFYALQHGYVPFKDL